jgi:hypothetical protein
MPVVATTGLTEAQSRAIARVEAGAEAAIPRARQVLSGFLRQAGEGSRSLDELLASLLSAARVTLNFHPDRLLPDGKTVAEGLLLDGRYRSQFETRVTNGSATAFAGGDRDTWEQRLFGGAYNPSVAAAERPKYGALNLMGHPDGASPRFGSCHLRLRPGVARRCTFSFGDSYTEPGCVGSAALFAPLLAALVASVEATGGALGCRDLDAPGLLRRLVSPFDHGENIELATSRGAGPVVPQGRALDEYIEAQVHGEIQLATDAEAIVVDPSFRGTPTEASLRAIDERFSLPIVFHAGFELAVDEVPDDFRGPAMPPLARRVDSAFNEGRGVIDAAVIGRAAATVHQSPEIWLDRGTLTETLQHLKQLWHVLVQFGGPRQPDRGGLVTRAAAHHG